MSPRRLVVAGVLRGRRWCGSALREPSSGAVYEGRLPARLEAVRPGPVGANRLDVTVSAAVVRRVPEPDQDVDLEAGNGAGGGSLVWVAWCPDCRMQPAGGPWSLACAEHLATVHDAVHHHGSWTARAVRAEQVPVAVGGEERFVPGAGCTGGGQS